MQVGPLGTHLKGVLRFNKNDSIHLFPNPYFPKWKVFKLSPSIPPPPPQGDFFKKITRYGRERKKKK